MELWSWWQSNYLSFCGSSPTRESNNKTQINGNTLSTIENTKIANYYNLRHGKMKFPCSVEVCVCYTWKITCILNMHCKFQLHLFEASTDRLNNIIHSYAYTAKFNLLTLFLMSVYFYFLSLSPVVNNIKYWTYWGCISEAFYCLEYSSSNSSHGEGSPTVVHDPPGARFMRP